MSDLTDRQIVERGERAKKALEEFVTPEFTYARQRYLDRIAEVAAQELSPALRQEKITTLALAVRVLNEVEGGVALVMHQGAHTREQLIRAEKLESLTDAQRRLINITGPAY